MGGQYAGGVSRRVPYLVAGVFAALYAAYSVLRHERLGSAGFDLGIFDQAVRSYAHFHGPVANLKNTGFNLLGDHFHPILVTLTPLYWLWPDARMLLVAQAVLLAVSIVPVGGLAIRRLGTRAGTAVTVAYGLSWGLQGALAFDFHEIAFGVPLIAFSMVALAEERWRTAVLWAAPLVLVKEDLGLTVAAVGVYLVVKRQWRLGAVTIVGGLAAMLLVIYVAIPYFSPTGRYRYWGYLSQGSAHSGDQGMLDNLLNLPASMVDHPAKPALLLFLAGVTAFAALRSPLLIVALPVLGYRLVSGNPLYWSTGPVHYNAILMPIVFVAMLDALPKLATAGRVWQERYASLVPAATLMVAVALVPRYALWQLVHPDFYRQDGHVTAAKQVLSMIPDGASVAAGDYLAPQLTDRCSVILFPDLYRRTADWVVVDSTRLGGVHATPAQQKADIEALPGQGYQRVADRDGVLLFHRLT